MSFANHVLFVVHFLNQFLTFLGLRSLHGSWGVVYDSVTKHPIDPAVVKLIDVDSGKVVQTCVSDLNGRYGFLAWPGKFKILVKKSNYIFPSRIVTGEHDGSYSNLYRGEFFEVTGDSDVISFDIPLDPVNPDWNQEAKKKITKTYPWVEYFLQRLTAVLFWFLFVLMILNLVLSPTKFHYIVLGFYGVIFLLAAVTPKPRLWGRVLKAGSRQPISGAVVELSHVEFQNISVSKAVTFIDGKFFLRAQPGNYFLKILFEDNLGRRMTLKTLKIKIDKPGIINKDIIV